MTMNGPADNKGLAPEGDVNDPKYYKKDFWEKENLKFSQPHYRLEKASRIINNLARDRKCTLLDIGCGPAALMHLLQPEYPVLWHRHSNSGAGAKSARSRPA